MGSPCTRRAWSGSMMGRFGCGTQVWRSETPTSHTGSARRDSPASSRPLLRARVLGQTRNGVSSIRGFSVAGFFEQVTGNEPEARG